MSETETAEISGELYEARVLNIAPDCEDEECENEVGKPRAADYELLSRELDHEGLTCGVLHLCEACLMRRDRRWGR